jgi:hypothetical protein
MTSYVVLELYNGATTKEAWDEHSPHFIDDWKPETRKVLCEWVQVTYRDTVRCEPVGVHSELYLEWDDDGFLEYDGCYFGDLSVGVATPDDVLTLSKQPLTKPAKKPSSFIHDLGAMEHTLASLEIASPKKVKYMVDLTTGVISSEPVEEEKTGA